MIMANRQVEVFDNKIENNDSVGLSICSYLVTQKPYDKDKGYDPFCEAIYVHDNKFDNNGTSRPAALGKLVAMVDRREATCRTSSTTASSIRRRRSTASCRRSWPFASATTATPISSISICRGST